VGEPGGWTRGGRGVDDAGGGSAGCWRDGGGWRVTGGGADG
jgi:hypothetical protein